MKPSELPFSRALAGHEELRQRLAHAVSECQIDGTRRGTGQSKKAQALHLLMTAVTSAINTLRDTTAPVISARTQPTGGNTVTLVYPESLDSRFVPLPGAFVFNPVRTVTGVEIDGNKVRVTYSGASLANGNTVAYTQAAATGHRDDAGNLAASFTAAAIAVS